MPLDNRQESNEDAGLTNENMSTEQTKKEDSFVSKKSIEKIIGKSCTKLKEIQKYLRDQAEADLRKQMIQSTVGYSQAAANNMSISEAQIRAHLNDGSQKILK